MRESVTYQAIVEEGVEKGREEGREEGRVQGVRKVLMRLGEKKLGPPSKRIVAELGKIVDAEHLERLVERIDGVKSWNELLAE